MPKPLELRALWRERLKLFIDTWGWLTLRDRDESRHEDVKDFTELTSMVVMKELGVSDFLFSCNQQSTLAVPIFSLFFPDESGFPLCSNNHQSTIFNPMRLASHTLYILPALLNRGRTV